MKPILQRVLEELIDFVWGVFVIFVVLPLVSFALGSPALTLLWLFGIVEVTW